MKENLGFMINYPYLNGYSTLGLFVNWHAITAGKFENGLLQVFLLHLDPCGTHLQHRCITNKEAFTRCSFHHISMGKENKQFII